MYSVLLVSQADYWHDGFATFDVSRFLEYTQSPLEARFKSLDASAIAELKSLPALFSFESGVEAPSRVGWFTDIQQRRNSIRIRYEFDEGIPPIADDQIAKILWELELDGSYETSRTHWAVKEVDLFKVLSAAGLLPENYTPRTVQFRVSRSTLLKACDFLKSIGHSDFDRFLLEVGIDAIKADRSVGGLAARAVALSQYALNNQNQFTAEGEPLALAIVRRAAQADPTYPEQAYLRDVTDAVRAGFWQGLNQDGYAFLDGQVVARPSDDTPFEKDALRVDEPSARPIAQGKAIMTQSSTKVFLVHGRDDAMKERVARFIEKLGLEAIVLHERPNRGRTIITKFREESATVAFAVVLMSPDDSGCIKGGEQQDRARQNVILELGFFLGALGPDRVCALVRGSLDIPSDFDGVVYIPFDGESWKVSLARELRGAGNLASSRPSRSRILLSSFRRSDADNVMESESNQVCLCADIRLVLA